ncbi:bifunctional DNA primase/polymerase [Paraburkholderia flagellata]|uniref:bifunctional DNA primase/polymerase n=1 Tax=Paraburkholderia flagellata TaxID=2883241 RepID=UPI001F463265|nr:bifunctional DNA primase/polymerase [Paraburkholderia flagellata]
MTDVKNPAETPAASVHNSYHHPENPLQVAACNYARAGAYVFPLVDGAKEPLNTTVREHAFLHGVHSATNDVDIVRACWEQHPRANIGIAMKPSGLVVWDIDVKDVDGMQDLHKYERQYGEVDTVRARTPSGGVHLYFNSGGQKIRSKANRARGWDLKATGGYVVAPPSSLNENVGKGYVAGVYEWIAWKEEAPLPSTLLEFLDATDISASHDEKTQGAVQPASIPSPYVVLHDVIIELIQRGWFEGCGYPSPSEARAAVYRAFMNRHWPDNAIAEVIEASLLRRHRDTTRRDVIGAELLADIARVRKLPCTNARKGAAE